MELKTIVLSYLSIAGFGMVVTLITIMTSSVLDDEFEGYGFWDWFIYNLLWIIHPVRAVVRFILRII